MHAYLQKYMSLSSRLVSLFKGQIKAAVPYVLLTPFTDRMGKAEPRAKLGPNLARMVTGLPLLLN